MKKKFRLPDGVTCLIVICVVFGYFGLVMGFANMLNTMMHTAHDLLINTVFFLMGMCVLTGALGKILIEFGVVDLLQRLLRPVMKPLFNMPGVASLGAVMTFLSDNPAIIALSQNKHFARYFKKFQHVSLVNFGTAFGMGLLVIVFMFGQGYVAAPLIGFVGAMCGCIISTRTMQHFTIKMYPNFLTEDALSPEEMAELDEEEDLKASSDEKKDTLFVRILNALLDGGKSGVEIGLAIIPGVLIISTFVMMLTFGGSSEGIDEAGNAIVVYTGGAYEGTRLLPWLGSKISFVFKWLFGFTAPELLAFPITALGAVGAALSLIPEFVSQGIVDGNAIAVCTAMGMCWSGFLSTDAATLDSLGYRPLVPKAFLSTFLGGICGGIITHWLYVGIMAVSALFAPHVDWEIPATATTCTGEQIEVNITSLSDGTIRIDNWYGIEDYDLCFKTNEDNSIEITNAYAEKLDKYFFVRINKDAVGSEPSYAAFYPSDEYAMFSGDASSGHFYAYTFIYDVNKRPISEGYYEIKW